MKLNKSILSAAIVASLGFAAQLHAQEAAKTENSSEATELDRVVVTGIRGSLQRALDTKRNSDAIIDVITAIDVGKFPSTNVAEAMALIPGVTIDKAFGQGDHEMADQTRQALAEVDRILAEAGTDKTRILSAQIWLADMADFPKMNAIWDTWAPQGHTPARATGESKLATPEYLVEVIVVAAL